MRRSQFNGEGIVIDEAIYLADKVLVMSASPGTIKQIINIDLPRPRHLDLKYENKFNDYKSQIWNLLKTESIINNF